MQSDVRTGNIEYHRSGIITFNGQAPYELRCFIVILILVHTKVFLTAPILKR